MFGCTQSLRLTQIFQLFANESLRFAPPFAAVSGGGLDGLGAFIGSRFDQPNLWAASASARLNVAIQFSMGNGWIHSGPINQRRDS